MKKFQKWLFYDSELSKLIYFHSRCFLELKKKKIKRNNDAAYTAPAKYTED